MQYMTPQSVKDTVKIIEQQQALKTYKYPSKTWLQQFTKQQPHTPTHEIPTPPPIPSKKEPFDILTYIKEYIKT